MKTCCLAALALLAAAIAGPACAQDALGGGTLEVHSGLSVSTLRPMRVPVTEDGSMLGLTALELSNGPALVEVTGDANRVYRLQIAGDNPEAASFQIWSSNVGDISGSWIAVMDDEGRDLLRIAGDPESLRRLFGEAGRIPLSIQYE